MPRWIREVVLLSTIALGSQLSLYSQFEDFTLSSDEHIMNQLDDTLVVRQVEGVVKRAVGDLGPLAGVLIEIQGPGDAKIIKKTRTDKRGRFRIPNVHEGLYKFKVTLDSFQSIIGFMEVTKKAPKRATVVFQMDVGV